MAVEADLTGKAEWKELSDPDSEFLMTSLNMSAALFCITKNKHCSFGVKPSRIFDRLSIWDLMKSWSWSSVRIAFD